MNNVAINGMGRIGRAVLKIIMENPKLQIAAVNDLLPIDNLSYLLRYDSVYGRYEKEVKLEGENLFIDGQQIKVYHEKDPSRLPWAEHKIDLVFECTGVFTTKEGMRSHLKAGAERVILSAPAKEGDLETVVHGVNSPAGDPELISCASCTTNCITPVVEIIGRRIGILKATMTTVHAYTSSQSLVDSPKSKWRRGRAAAVNFVPTSTGAAKATTKVLTQYSGKFDGAAIRGPVPAGSIADMVFMLERRTSIEEINNIFKEESQSKRYRGIIGIATDPIVSSDVVQDPRASIVDLSMTQVVDGDLLKVMSWYDNEWGYSSQMVREAERMIHGHD